MTEDLRASLVGLLAFSFICFICIELSSWGPPLVWAFSCACGCVALYFGGESL